MPPNRARRKYHCSLHNHLSAANSCLRALFSQHYPCTIIGVSVDLHDAICNYDFLAYG